MISLAMALGMHLSVLDGGLTGSTRADKWTASMMIIPMTLVLLALLAYHTKVDKFTGMPTKGGFLLIILALWSAGIPVIMDPSNYHAQAQDQLT